MTGETDDQNGSHRVSERLPIKDFDHKHIHKQLKTIKIFLTFIGCLT